MQMWHLSGVSWDSSFHEHLRGRKVKKGLVLGGDGRLWQAVERRKRRRGREIVPGWGRLRKEGIRSNASISPVTEVPQLAIHPSLPTFCTSQQEYLQKVNFRHFQEEVPVNKLSQKSTFYQQVWSSTKYNIALRKIFDRQVCSHICVSKSPHSEGFVVIYRSICRLHLISESPILAIYSSNWWVSLAFPLRLKNSLSENCLKVTSSSSSDPQKWEF